MVRIRFPRAKSQLRNSVQVQAPALVCGGRREWVGEVAASIPSRLAPSLSVG